MSGVSLERVRATRLLLVIVPLVMLLLGAGTAEGQRYQRGIREVSEEGRRGFWGMMGLGVGGQGFRLAGDDRFQDVLYKPTAVIRMGGTVSPHLRLGIEGSAWINSTRDDAETVATAMLIGQVYPARKAGLFFKAGAGIGRNGFDTFDGFSEADIGLTTSLGIGAEFRMGKYLFLVPTVDYTWHFYENRDASSYRMRVVSFGLALLFQG